MTFRKSLLAVGVLALIPLCAVAAMRSDVAGAGGGFMHRGGMHGSELSFLKGVSLTDAQHAQLHQLMRSEWTATQPLHEQLRTLRQEIADRLASTASVSNAQLTALQDKAEALHHQIDTQRLATALQVRALLTPAQLASAAEVHQELAKLHDQMRAVLSQSEGAERQ